MLCLSSCDTKTVGDKQIEIFETESMYNGVFKILCGFALVLAGAGVMINGFVVINHNYKEPKKEKK